MTATVEALIDAMDTPAGWADGSLTIRYANAALLRWSHAHAPELLAQSPRPHQRGPVAEALRELARRGLAGEAATDRVHLAQAGETGITATVHALPHQDRAGRPVAVLRWELPGRHPDHGEVEELARIGTYVTDLHAGTWTGSQGFCKIFGFEAGHRYPVEEFQALVHPDDVDGVMSFFAQCLQEGRPFDCEYRCLRRGDGALIHVRSTTKVLMDDAGQPHLLVGIKQDITELKELQLRLARTNRMETTGKLAGGIAHDFNNMLGAILSFSDVARMDAEDNAEVQRSLGELERVVLRSRALVNKLLDFARQREVQPRALDPGALLHDMRELLGSVVGAGVGFELQLAPDTWPVRIDVSSLEQVLVNLASNAAHAMGGRGHFVVSTENLTLDAPHPLRSGDTLSPGDYVRIRARDDGPGIDPSIMEHLFEPFFTTKDAGEGRGLGLATSYGVVRQAGGHIGVDTDPNRGTTLSIYLPRSYGPAPPPASPGAERPVVARRRALIVDDNPPLLMALQRMFEKLGYDVTTAADGARALEALADAGFDLLLSDLVMPGLSGDELAAQARSSQPGLRVLMMSGDPGAVPADRQADDVLRKPFTVSELARRLEALFADAD